jgi:hypothetical protein
MERMLGPSDLLLSTSLGPRVQPVSGLQQFRRFLFHLFSHRLGPFPKLIGFGGDEDPSAAEQQQAEDRY